MMLIIYHDGTKVVEVNNANSSIVAKLNTLTIAEFLVVLAREYPDTILVWCHVNLKTQLNVSEIESLFHHRKLMYSYNPSDGSFIDRAIGYVEESPFIKINKEVSFPSWQMSSCVGGIYAEVLLALNNEMPFDKDFDYFLNSLAKLGMPKGLLCYSEPRLLKQNLNNFSVKSSSYTLFRFVKQHYKTQWVFLLFFNLAVYERKLPGFPFLFSLLYKNRSQNKLNFDDIMVESSRKVVNKRSIDVIIPTIGRSSYLYDVLKDFRKQTLLPHKIIIVEQNPLEESKTELNYIEEEQWPFDIQHLFIHQAGACNARNLALEQTNSEWVFLADDDNRFDDSLFSDVFDKIGQYGVQVVTTSYLQKKENKKHTKVIQWPTFGAGNSFVKKELLDSVRFNKALEFGYGEDGDFGMQLRNQGNDVLYLPEPSILHLKAAIGGFRTKPTLQWQSDKIQPKPSPTIMLYQLSHNTVEQIRGYKTILFFKYYKFQEIRNPFRYYSCFQKQWGKSIFWANKLKKQNEV
jgi:glycosyltransferase involved in cell wall biosynthesis